MARSRRDPDEIGELDAHLALRRITTVMRRRGVVPPPTDGTWAEAWVEVAEFIEWLDRRAPSERERAGRVVS